MCFYFNAPNVLQYETIGFSGCVLYPPTKKLTQEPNPHKLLNPNCFTLRGRLGIFQFINYFKRYFMIFNSQHMAQALLRPAR